MTGETREIKRDLRDLRKDVIEKEEIIKEETVEKENIQMLKVKLSDFEDEILMKDVQISNLEALVTTKEHEEQSLFSELNVKNKGALEDQIKFLESELKRNNDKEIINKNKKNVFSRRWKEYPNVKDLNWKN